MATLLRANRPRTTDILAPGGKGVVRSLAERASDGMNRRQIDHIETHGGGISQLGFTILKAGMFIAQTGAWEKFIPGAEASTLAVHHENQLRVVASRQTAVGIPPHHRSDFIVLGNTTLLRRGGAAAQIPDRRIQSICVAAGDIRGGFLDHLGTGQEYHPKVWVGIGAFRQVMAPGLKMIHPGRDRIAITSHLLCAEGCAPPVISQSNHRDFGPLAVDLATV